MSMIRIAGGAAVALVLTGGTAAAQALPAGVSVPTDIPLPTSTTVLNLSDGTRVEQTITSPTSLTVKLTGGPTFGPTPATVNVTNLQVLGADVRYSGNVMIAGTTTAFNCSMNTTTQAITGDSICNTAFGGQPAAPVVTTPPVVTPPTTTTTTTGGGTTTTTTGGGGAVTTTTTPGGTTTTTITTPTATVTITAQEQDLIRNVRTEQFWLSMMADRISVANAQGYISDRLRSMAMAGLASAGLNIGGVRARGMNAGEGGLTPGVWANASGAYLKDGRIGSGVDGHDYSAALGADLSTDSLTLGVFATYGDVKMSGSNTRYRSDGWSGGGYARWAPLPQFRVTATIGAGSQDVLFDRTAGALRSRGTTDRDSRFGSVSVDSQWALSKRLIAIPSAGVLFSSSDTDAYVDTAGRRFGAADSDLSLGTAGGTLYYVAGGVLPFVQAAVNHQFNRQAGVDRTYGQIGGGLVAPIGGSASFVASVQTLLWKQQERETRVNIALRRSF